MTVRTCKCIVRRDGLELQKIVALVTLNAMLSMGL
jgi:hypothetical protein